MSRTLQRALLLLGMSALLSAVGATGATANRLRIAAQNLTRTGPVTLRTPEGRIIRCETRMRGSVGGTISKVVGTVIGRITEVTVEGCVGGIITARNLPWDKTYDAFTGTLPRVASVRARIRREWEAIYNEMPGLRCIYNMTPMVGSYVLPGGELFIISEATWIRSSTAFCPEIRESGSLLIETAIRVELI
jgi:hypothetical protein